MTTQTPLVTGTDFITVATKDIDAAMEFYGDVLGLRFSKRWGQMPAAEFETGTLTIAVMQSDAFGLEFSPTTIRSRCVWTTSRPPARSSSRAACSSRGTSSTPASATRPSSRIRTATCSGFTTATHLRTRRLTRQSAVSRPPGVEDLLREAAPRALAAVVRRFGDFADSGTRCRTRRSRRPRSGPREPRKTRSAGLIDLASW
jgi:catechol 2,3-dioxygenase-like lactoylglutathione lyase family enzyme